MKYFLISYRFCEGTEAEWHRTIASFVADLNGHPGLAGKISYHCLKAKGGMEYYHLAIVSDEEAGALLGRQDFFKAYTKETERVGGGEVSVTPLEIIAETGPLT